MSNSKITHQLGRFKDSIYKYSGHSVYSRKYNMLLIKGYGWSNDVVFIQGNTVCY